MNDANDYSDVLAYLITFHTYGTWLHGDERGSVDREHNLPGTDLLPADATQEQRSVRRMMSDAITLDNRRRRIVESTICRVVEHRGWMLHAINVRTNHVHVVVTANTNPEAVMNSLKSWSTRRMVEAGLFEPRRKAWVRHGSTRYLWDEKALDDAVRYVIEGQGVDLGETESRDVSMAERRDVSKAKSRS